MCQKKIVLEDSFQKLYNNTVGGFTTKRKESSHRVQVTTTAFVPSNNSLQVRSKTKTNGPDYDTVVFFDDVEYTDDPNSVTFMAPDNTEYSIIPIPANANVQVNCTCLDFYYRFSVWNAKNDSLFGNAPKPYIKKTDRLPQNPRHLPGLCHHLIKLFDHLKQEKIIR